MEEPTITTQSQNINDELVPLTKPSRHHYLKNKNHKLEEQKKYANSKIEGERK